MALGIERVGEGQCIGIELNDGVELGPSAIDLRNPCEIGGGQFMGGELTGPHAILQLIDGGFGVGEIGGGDDRGEKCRHEQGAARVFHGGSRRTAAVQSSARRMLRYSHFITTPGWI